MSAEEVIIVTARKRTESGSNGFWSAIATRTSGPGGNGGDGGGPGSTAIVSEADLMKAIAKLDSNDKIIIRVEGMPTVVIDGLPAGDFFAEAFNQIVSVFTAISDGRLQAALPGLPAHLRPIVGDLIEDTQTAFRNGHFIRMTNTDNLQPYSSTPVPPNATSLTKSSLQPDSLNLDADQLTTDHHQIYFNSSKLGAQLSSGFSSLVHNGNKSLDTIQVAIFHELFHILEGETTADAEYIALGIPGSTSGARRENHNDIYDLAAMNLHKLARKFDPDLRFDATPSFDHIRTGGIGSDSMNLFVASNEMATVDTREGDDAVDINFSESVIDTGSGDDTLTLQAGQGRIMWYDPSGTDTLILPSATGLPDVAVERLGDWNYVGVKGVQGFNMSATELTNVIMFRDSAGPEFVSIAGVTYSIDYIRSLGNSKPDFYFAPEITYQAPFSGGYVADLPGADADGDPLTYSVVGVQGMGAGASWWFDGTALFTSYNYNVQDTRLSLVTVRVSDGKLYQDYDVPITWAPDPYSDIDPYRLGPGTPGKGKAGRGADGKARMEDASRADQSLLEPGIADAFRAADWEPLFGENTSRLPHHLPGPGEEMILSYLDPVAYDWDLQAVTAF